MKDYTVAQRLRSAPTPEWIAETRNRFPVERTIDEVLTRKLESRRRGGEHHTDVAALAAGLESYLLRVTEQPDAVFANLHRLTGGASKEQFTFDLTWRPGGAGEVTTRKLILRMDPSESIVETHRLREAQLLRAMSGVVPVPEVFWVEPTGSALGHPFLIAGFLEGTVQPEEGKRASGLGMYFAPELRSALSDQFVRHLASIHTVDWRACDLSAFDQPTSGTTQANEWSLNSWERIWHEDTVESHPIVAQAATWLREHMPVVERPVIVHGDYRSGNFMYTDDCEINAVLDWELAHLGDHHEDLAYAASAILGCADETGRNLVCGLLTRERFLDRYQELSGLTVDEGLLFYYEVFIYYKMAVIAVATSRRVAHGRRTHLDAMMNLLSGFGYVGICHLQRMLDSGPALDRGSLRVVAG